MSAESNVSDTSEPGVVNGQGNGWASGNCGLHMRGEM